MTVETTKPSDTPVRPDAQQSARTDDLLASGADPEDGARGYDSKADPQTLQTGMEGIADANKPQGNHQSESNKPAATNQTLPDNPGHLRNEQKS